MDSDTHQKEVLTALYRTLHEYLEAVPQQQRPNPPDLLALFERLDAFETQLKPGIPPELRHYMHQKSYRKAYLFLRGQDSENVNGNCVR
jgi:hypothetical protein